MDSMLGTFIGYFFGTLGNKASIIFSGTAFLWCFFWGASCRLGLLWVIFVGCVIENGWCFFPWSFKGITDNMPEPWIPPRGKLEKKAIFSPYYQTKTTTYYNRTQIVMLFCAAQGRQGTPFCTGPSANPFKSSMKPMWWGSINHISITGHYEKRMLPLFKNKKGRENNQAEPDKMVPAEGFAEIQGGKEGENG